MKEENEHLRDQGAASDLDRALPPEAAVPLPEPAAQPMPDPALIAAQVQGSAEGSAQPPPGSGSRTLAVNVLAGGGANLVKIGLQLVMLPLMAHLLGPAEFGVYALALPTVAFFMTLADGGLGASLAREPTQSREIWSTAFWLVLMVGAGLTLIVAGWGVILAQLSREPRVADVMGLLSVSFLFVTVSVLPYARLTRERRLAAISGADLAGNLIGAAVAVMLALGGAGAMSLAAQYVILYLVRGSVLNLLAFVRPSLVFRPAMLKAHVSTGSALVASRLVDFAGRLVENLVFGRNFGPAALGTFTFANQVPRFVCEAASGPLWGALYAHALREDDAHLARLHAKLVHILSLLLAPVAFLTAAVVPGLILRILGPAWSDAATILSILIPFYALNAVAHQSGALLLAKGSGWTLFRLSLLLVVARVAAVLPGPWLGPFGVAWGIGVAQVLFAGLMLRAPGRIGLSPTGPLLRGMLAPTLAGIAAGLACHVIVQGAPTEIPRIALGLVAGLVGYLVVLFLLEGSRLREDLGGLRRLMRR
ncbi:oligosaccharide flippase family protein [Methylorubrum thiocyanatum]|uniref:oligosaccharide flippase family protein n=1 Tax=Methylorubrum thiocyanatum TaxID=47958 RepID=UPI00383BAA42